MAFGAVTASKSVSVKAASHESLRTHPLIAARWVALKPVSLDGACMHPFTSVNASTSVHTCIQPSHTASDESASVLAKK